MSRGRPPRRVRFPAAVNIPAYVHSRVTKFSPEEIDQVLAPVKRAMTALREGVATELQWAVLASSVEVAIAIEDQRVVRGLRGHLKNAEAALAGIRLRAMDSGEWRPTELFYQELDDIAEAIRLHEFQLEQLSAGELNEALKSATGRVRAAGGTVIDVRQLELAA